MAGWVGAIVMRARFWRLVVQRASPGKASRLSSSPQVV
jgi:hypothetical protein